MIVTPVPGLFLKIAQRPFQQDLWPIGDAPHWTRPFPKNRTSRNNSCYTTSWSTAACGKNPQWWRFVSYRWNLIWNRDNFRRGGRRRQESSDVAVQVGLSWSCLGNPAPWAGPWVASHPIRFHLGWRNMIGQSSWAAQRPWPMMCVNFEPPYKNSDE